MGIYSLGAFCAILGLLDKRIEKKLSFFRCGNFNRAASSETDTRAVAPDDSASLVAESKKARAEKTWIITDGSVGMEAQGIAVAEAVGLPFSLKRVRITGAMQFVPARLQIYVPPKRLLRSVACNEPLQLPWPRLIISIGRRSVPVALAVKHLSGAFALHIQDPKVPPRLFDLVAALVHDGLTGNNVVTTFGSVHSVTEAKLKEEMRRFAAQIEALPKPRVAVLLGGKSQAFRFTAEVASQFGAELAELSRKYGASLLVTPSRRTSSEAIAALAEKIRDEPHLIWDGTGDNPYFAYLAHADFIVVTQDSINMVTEAAGTGKPIYIKTLPGHSRRQSHFHALMREAGVTRPFDCTLELWSYTPINDRELVASKIRQSLGLDNS